MSGGGENGAFGSGLLCGWSEHGTRPVFELVTGISTGALTAPFAYLGSSYDPQLRAVYTELKSSSVFFKRGLTAALFDDALSDNSPLFKTISGYLDEAMLAALAHAYEDGRLLLIGTTDLDAQQPVIWNIGAIAKSGHPRALDTIRRILLASAAIPGAFPPTLFDVVLDGKPYQEMHVDGGAFAQAFLYPAGLTRQRRARMTRGQQVVSATAYVIRNGRLDAEWASTERSTMGIAGRAISTMIAASGLNDVIRMYNNTQRDGIGFNLAYIGSDLPKSCPSRSTRVHEGIVRLRLPTCPPRLRLGETATSLDDKPYKSLTEEIIMSAARARGTASYGCADACLNSDRPEMGQECHRHRLRHGVGFAGRIGYATRRARR